MAMPAVSNVATNATVGIRLAFFMSYLCKKIDELTEREHEKNSTRPWIKG